MSLRSRCNNKPTLKNQFNQTRLNYDESLGSTIIVSDSTPPEVSLFKDQNGSSASKNLLAGTNITLDDNIPNCTITINAEVPLQSAYDAGNTIDLGANALEISSAGDAVLNVTTDTVHSNVPLILTANENVADIDTNCTALQVGLETFDTINNLSNTIPIGNIPPNSSRHFLVRLIGKSANLSFFYEVELHAFNDGVVTTVNNLMERDSMNPSFFNLQFVVNTTPTISLTYSSDSTDDFKVSREIILFSSAN